MMACADLGVNRKKRFGLFKLFGKITVSAPVLAVACTYVATTLSNQKVLQVQRIVRPPKPSQSKGVRSGHSWRLYVLA